MVDKNIGKEFLHPDRMPEYIKPLLETIINDFIDLNFEYLTYQDDPDFYKFYIECSELKKNIKGFTDLYRKKHRYDDIKNKELEPLRKALIDFTNNYLDYVKQKRI